jgi:hypothetical protein
LYPLPIEITNEEIKQLRARINKLDKWIVEESVNLKPPTLADIISDILSRTNKSSLTNLHDAARIHNFLVENDVADFADLERKVNAMHGKVNRLRDDMKPVSRRIQTLDVHLTHSENLKKYRKIYEKQEALYAEYRRLDKQGFFFKGKAKEAFAAAEAYDWKHLNALRDYDDAEKYLRGVLRERFDPKKLPIAMWTEERAAKIAEQTTLNREYRTLEAETKNVEQIKRSVTEILRVDSPEPARAKKRDMAL